MAQAKTLTPQDIDRVLAYVARGHFPLRNRVILLTGLWSGMRVGELANLRLGDVLEADGSVKSEIRLAAWQTKGRRPRTVFLPEKLRTELGNYLSYAKSASPSTRCLSAALVVRSHPTPCVSTSSGSSGKQALPVPAVIRCGVLLSPTWPVVALASGS